MVFKVRDQVMPLSRRFILLFTLHKDGFHRFVINVFEASWMKWGTDMGV